MILISHLCAKCSKEEKDHLDDLGDALGVQSEKHDHLQLLYDENAAKMAQSQLSNGDPAATM